MSKSLGNIISIFENEDIIKKQVMSTYTDPTRKHATDPGHVEGNMVFAYLEFFGEKAEVDRLKERYTKGQVSDIEVKNYLFKALMKTFAPARARYQDLKNHPEKVKKILADGAAKATAVSAATMKEVRDVIGLTNRYSFLQGDALQKTIRIDEFARVEMRVGKVLSAVNVEKSEKLIRLTVDFGAFGKRMILTGVRGYGYTPEDFRGKQFMFAFNLAPRKIMGEESQGMILAVDSPRGEAGGPDKPIFLTAEGMPIGAKIR